MVGENVLVTLDARMMCRTHADQREIRCAAADVGDQHDLFGGYGGFIVQGRCNGFKLKSHFGKSGRMTCGGEAVLCFAVALAVTIDEPYRTTDDGALQCLAVL